MTSKSSLLQIYSVEGSEAIQRVTGQKINSLVDMFLNMDPARWQNKSDVLREVRSPRILERPGTKLEVIRLINYRTSEALAHYCGELKIIRCIVVPVCIMKQKMCY